MTFGDSPMRQQTVFAGYSRILLPRNNSLEKSSRKIAEIDEPLIFL
jgi:hypothetical protein